MPLFLPLFLCSVALDERLLRLAEEAEVFAGAAARIIGVETLEQRALKAPPRRLRIGKDAAAEHTYQKRQIVSEYGFALFHGDDETSRRKESSPSGGTHGAGASPGAWHEVRQAVSVDGREIKTATKARRTLSEGMRSSDDRLKKKLLEDLEKHGLSGSVTDFGLTLMLFRKRHLADYAFDAPQERFLGTERVRVFRFAQRGGDGAFTVFEGRKALRQPLQGEVWLRASDGLPVRIRLVSLISEPGAPPIRDEGSVDYGLSPRGHMLPLAVVHRRYSGSLLVTENLFTYSGYKVFGAESEIRFDADPSDPKPGLK